MNVQDAKDLHITEGNVRTIYDSLGNQLWGRANYNTSYNGDTTQQTYSGTNLYNYTDTTGTIGSGITTDGDGWITCTIDNSGGTSTRYSNYYTNPLALTPSTNYALVLEIRSVSGTGQIEGGGSNATTQVTTYRVDFENMTAGSTIIIPILSKSDVSGTNGLRTYFRFNAGQSGSVTVRISVLADTSVTPSTFVYQPYTGGIPAPNPDYPQTVNVVTGTQTVTITGGIVSNNFTLNLGAIELCKIGSYQDYIYKSGNDWYVHKATEKVVLVGSNSENWQYNAGNAVFTLADYLSYAIDGTAPVSNYYIGQANVTGYSQLNNNSVALLKSSTNNRLLIKNTAFSTNTAFKNWLSSNNTSLYYPLATATDTKITDATLVGQLNAVHEWLTRYGYTATVSGSLPIIISQTNL